MTNAVEAVGKDVQQKAANELIRLEAHDSFAAVAAIVFVSEGDFLIAHRDEPRVGDGGAMSVAAEIGEDLLGTAEGRLGPDDPIGLA